MSKVPSPRARKPAGSHVNAVLKGFGFLAVFSAVLCTLDTSDENTVYSGQIVMRISGLLGLLLVLHVLFLRHTRSPYYIAHIIVNFVICVIAFKDLVFMLTDTANALRITKVDSWAMDVCNALHFYHVFAFTDLRFVDYLHHVIMVFFCMPLFYVAEYGPIANYNMFFVSGLPGGIDYIMLYLVRSKKLRKIQEKRWNTSINIWIRGPFLLGSVFFSHVQMMMLWEELTRSQIVCRVICQIVQFWNAMYFTESVVGDYYRLSLKKGKIALYHDLSDSDSEEDHHGSHGGVDVTERFLNRNVDEAAAKTE
eukprot:TRINITY_DN515_c0_g1_i1.p1 TRINITY_DN515_c0_g1~~TRINITY_DN515_c0_g1_i1.p1  ORF type:complete len:309 (+),score=35.22 TRINITY_DN515_c0_g1_i1:42-968(+)